MMGHLLGSVPTNVSLHLEDKICRSDHLCSTQLSFYLYFDFNDNSMNYSDLACATSLTNCMKCTGCFAGFMKWSVEATRLCALV